MKTWLFAGVVLVLSASLAWRGEGQAAQAGKHESPFACDRLALDPKRFATELRDHVHVARVRQDEESGRRCGVRATPTFFVNGSICDVSFGVQALERTIEKALA